MHFCEMTLKTQDYLMASLRGVSSPMVAAQEWVLSSLGTTWPSQEHGWGGGRVWAAERLVQVTSEGSTGALTGLPTPLAPGQAHEP